MSKRARGFWSLAVACVLNTSALAMTANENHSEAITPMPERRVADYAAALSLRERWMYLTEGIAGPVTWIDTEQFRYRKTVLGGFQFVTRHVSNTSSTASFDHERLAQGLSKALGETVLPHRLPFTDYRLSSQGAMEFWLGEALWRCELEVLHCAPVSSEKSARPRAWGVVRDLSVPADSRGKPSPDGRYEALIRDNNVVVRTLASGKETPLTQDGVSTHFYDADSLVWSPDSRTLATYQVIPGSQRQVTRIETSPRGGDHPVVHTQHYPKPGDAVDIEQPIVLDVFSGKVQRVDRALFPEAYSLSPMTFRADSKSFSFRYVARDRKRVSLIEVNTESANARVVVDEVSESFVNDWANRAAFHEIDRQGERVLWMSERDGWNHLYLLNTRSGKIHQLTRGEWVVRQIIKIDSEKNEVWFAASGRESGDPYFQHVYRMNLEGAGLIHLTPGEGSHDFSLSPDSRYYTHTWSRVDQADTTHLRDARSGRLIREVEKADVTALLKAGYRPPEVFIAPGRDGVTPIYGVVVRPQDYDREKRYPVVENIYAGPHDAFVPKTFWPFGYHSGGDKQIGMQALANLGFIVVQMDGMGTMHRSKAFHDVAWKNLGDAGFPDRIAWHRALAAVDPAYDLSGGVGIYGASAGGQNVLSALLFHADFYRVGVGMNGCYDNRMDKLSWNEQWMGWPVDESYARASGVENAHLLKGQLMMVLGEQDTNVDPASTYQVADALIRSGKDFELLVVPGGGHAVGRSQEPIDYVTRRMFDFFLKHLKSESIPAWNKTLSAPSN